MCQAGRLEFCALRLRRVDNLKFVKLSRTNTFDVSSHDRSLCAGLGFLCFMLGCSDRQIHNCSSYCSAVSASPTDTLRCCSQGIHETVLRLVRTADQLIHSAHYDAEGVRQRLRKVDEKCEDFMIRLDNRRKNLALAISFFSLAQNVSTTSRTIVSFVPVAISIFTFDSKPFPRREGNCPSEVCLQSVRLEQIPL